MFDGTIHRSQLEYSILIYDGIEFLLKLYLVSLYKSIIKANTLIYSLFLAIIEPTGHLCHPANIILFLPDMHALRSSMPRPYKLKSSSRYHFNIHYTHKLRLASYLPTYLPTWE